MSTGTPSEKTIPAAISDVLSPPPASPRGRLNLKDIARAAISLGIKTGLFALALTQADLWAKALQNPYTSAAVCGLISTGVTLLRMATNEPEKSR